MFHCNVPKFLVRQVWANSVDPDQTATGQGLHCLSFHQHFFVIPSALFCGKIALFKFEDTCIFNNFSGV